MKKRMMFVLLVLALLLVSAVPALAARPGTGHLFYDGDVVRTLVPPAAFPNEGIDPVYPIMGGVEGQLPIAGVAPGDPDYHGGHWAVHVVTWNTAPYLLTSEADVWAAEAAGAVTVTRNPGADFLCPIQP